MSMPAMCHGHFIHDNIGPYGPLLESLPSRSAPVALKAETAGDGADKSGQDGEGRSHTGKQDGKAGGAVARQGRRENAYEPPELVGRNADYKGDGILEPSPARPGDSIQPCHNARNQEKQQSDKDSYEHSADQSSPVPLRHLDTYVALYHSYLFHTVSAVPCLQRETRGSPKHNGP